MPLVVNTLVLKLNRLKNVKEMHMSTKPANVFNIDNSTTNAATTNATYAGASAIEQSVTQQIERSKGAIEYAECLGPDEKAEATLALTDSERDPSLTPA